MKRRFVVSLILIGTVVVSILAAFFAVTHGTLIFPATRQQPTVKPVLTPTPTTTPTPQPVLTVKGPYPTVTASAIYLIDQNTGNVLIDYNGEKPLPMASTTKIMTALIAIQSADLEQRITISQEAVNYVIQNDSSSAGLVAGDTLTLRDLLYGLMLNSGGDAAYAIAETLGETQAQFVERMNLFAYHHQLFQTHYATPDGLSFEDTHHYSTAYDLARLAAYAMRNPTFAHIVGTQHYKVSTERTTYTWENTNKLLGTYKGMKGIKTGHTFAAGYCLVFAASRNGQHLLGVLLNSPNEEQRAEDVTKLLDWGFKLPLLPPA